MGMSIGNPKQSQHGMMNVKDVFQRFDSLKRSNVLFVIAIFDDRRKGSYG